MVLLLWLIQVSHQLFQELSGDIQVSKFDILEGSEIF